MSADWQIGDLALCVNNGKIETRLGVHMRQSSLKVGALYRVTGMYLHRRVALTLIVDGARSPDERGGFDASRFRKIRPHTPDAEDAETIRLLSGLPVQEPVA